MDTVSEQDKFLSRRGTPIIVVPFPGGVNEISVTNNTSSLTTTAASFCAHYN